MWSFLSKYLFWNTNTGVVTTVAGSSQGFGDGASDAAKFHGPIGISVDSTNGDIYVADYLNHRIRKISSGMIIK